MSNTNHLNIPLVLTAQAQKEVTVNEAISRMDAILNTGIIDRGLATPPGSPGAGDIYIVASGGTGDWSGKDSQVAYFDQLWRFIIPNEGMTLWSNDDNALYTYNGSNWVLAASNNLGKQQICVSASQIRPSAASGCAALATTSTGAGKPSIHTLNFDAAAAEYAEFSIPMPRRWNGGGGDMVIEWSHAATTVNFDVVWGIQALCIGSGDALAVNFSAANTQTASGGSTDTLYKTTISNITLYNGPDKGDSVYFRVGRVAGDAADTLAIDARLHAASFLYYSDAPTDD